jgi:DNA polymerase-4
MTRHAQGIDDRSVIPEREAKQVSAETTFARDIADGAALRRTLLHLSEEVGRRLRASDLAASTVKLKLRWPDFTTLTRQVTLAGPTNLDDEIYRAAAGLFDSVWKRGGPVRLLGVATTGLIPPVRQLGLWEAAGQSRSERLVAVVDSIREKYGRAAIRRASLVDESPGEDRE